MIKAIFLDWGNVFGTSSKEKERKLDVILKPFGFSWKRFYPIWWQFYLLRSSGKIKTDREFEAYIRKVVGKNIPVKEIINTRISCQVIPENHIEVVRELKKKYKVGILSNHVEEWIRQIIKNYKLKKLFDALIISSKVGARKPDALIYYTALKEFSIKPEQAIFVADEVAEDLVLATGLGIKTVWFKTNQTGLLNENDEKVLKIYRPDATISNLKELPSAIERIELTKV
jgi:HAD superfamily hydrolase (TIGR01509 family)